MENDYTLDSDMNAELHLSGESRNNLDQTARWAKFLAIIGFIFLGLMVLGALSIGLVMGDMPIYDEELPFSPTLLVMLYLAVAALYFFPILYLYRFATSMKDALQRNDQLHLDVAFANIKAHYKYVGILMIILLGFYALLLIGIVIGGLAMGF